MYIILLDHFEQTKVPLEAKN